MLTTVDNFEDLGIPEDIKVQEKCTVPWVYPSETLALDVRISERVLMVYQHRATFEASLRSRFAQGERVPIEEVERYYETGEGPNPIRNTNFDYIGVTQEEYQHLMLEKHLVATAFAHYSEAISSALAVRMNPSVREHIHDWTQLSAPLLAEYYHELDDKPSRKAYVKWCVDHFLNSKGKRFSASTIKRALEPTGDRAELSDLLREFLNVQRMNKPFSD